MIIEKPNRNRILRMKIFTQSILGAALLGGGASLTIHGQGFSGSIAVGQASTNGIVRQPRDAKAEIAFNPFLKLRTNEQDRVLFDYQYRSTNAVASATRAVIEIHPEGATGRGGRHTVHFKANLKDNGVVIVMPDNQILEGRVVALSISDDRGHRAWLGELKDCQGQVVGERANQVLYPDAFQGLRADILFTYDLNYIQQDVVIREWPVLPPEIEETSARLEAWSEFVRAPEPRKTINQVVFRESSSLANGGKPIISDDESLDFTSMRMVPGRVFRSTDEDSRIDLAPRPLARVVKRWIREGTASYLVESADFLSLKPSLETLNRRQARAGAVTEVTNLAFLSNLWKPSPQDVALQEGPKKSALKTLLALRSVNPQPGVVLDYRLVTTSLLNINFGTAADRVGPAAAGKSSDDYWNVFNTAWTTFGTLDNLAWSEGNGSGIQLSLENAPGVWGNSTGDTMMDGYVYPWSYVENATVRLNNVPTGIYDFYIYGAWGGVGVVNGNYVLSVVYPGIGGESYGQRQTVLGPNWASLNWTEGEHYVLYPNVTVDYGTQVEIVAMPGADVALFNGLQMISTGSGNSPPTISGLPDQTIPKNTSTDLISFMVNDDQTPANSLTITVNSSNPTLVPNGNITLLGTDYNRSIAVTPALGQIGTATISVVVSDGTAAACTTFDVTVTENYVEISKSSMVADASTTGFGWLPANAINGSITDPGWHNEEGRIPGTDWLRVNLGSTYAVGRVQYQPREWADNGTFLQYSIYVTDNFSSDMNSWGDPVASGSWSWPNGAETKTQEFPPKGGQYVIFRCLQGSGYDRYASAGEVWVYALADSGADIDGDGLTLGQELALGWDPFKYDTDGDGVSDGDEDYDGDLLSNKAEYNTYNSNAKVPNSKIPEITDAEYFHIAKHGPETPVKLTGPQVSGGNLVFGLTGADHVYDLYYKSDLNQPWSWYAQGNAPVTTGFTVPIPPGNGFFIAGSAADRDGDGLSDAYEQLISRTIIDTWDSDGDGLSDGVEVARGYSPTEGDSNGNGIGDGYEDYTGDGDGLANLMEAAFGTNPWSFDDVNGNGVADWREDSDSDGLPDSYERLLGLNPVVAEGPPPLPNPLDKCPIGP